MSISGVHRTRRGGGCVGGRLGDDTRVDRQRLVPTPRALEPLARIATPSRSGVADTVASA